MWTNALREKPVVNFVQTHTEVIIATADKGSHQGTLPPCLFSYVKIDVITYLFDTNFWRWHETAKETLQGENVGFRPFLPYQKRIWIDLMLKRSIIY